MSVYGVTVPIAGSYFVEVEAENEEEAKSKALDADWDVDFNSQDGAELLALDKYERLVQGNVVYVQSVWEIEVEDYGEEE